MSLRPLSRECRRINKGDAEKNAWLQDHPAKRKASQRRRKRKGLSQEACLCALLRVLQPQQDFVGDLCRLDVRFCVSALQISYMHTESPPT